MSMKTLTFSEIQPGDKYYVSMGASIGGDGKVIFQVTQKTSNRIISNIIYPYGLVDWLVGYYSSHGISTNKGFTITESEFNHTSITTKQSEIENILENPVDWTAPGKWSVTDWSDIFVLVRHSHELKSDVPGLSWQDHFLVTKTLEDYSDNILIEDSETTLDFTVPMDELVGQNPYITYDTAFKNIHVMLPKFRYREIELGSRVMANYMHSGWWRTGIIVGTKRNLENEGKYTYTINYDDGDFQDDLKEDEVTLDLRQPGFIDENGVWKDGPQNVPPNQLKYTPEPGTDPEETPETYDILNAVWVDLAKNRKDMPNLSTHLLWLEDGFNLNDVLEQYIGRKCFFYNFEKWWFGNITNAYILNTTSPIFFDISYQLNRGQTGTIKTVGDVSRISIRLHKPIDESGDAYFVDKLLSEKNIIEAITYNNAGLNKYVLNMYDPKQQTELYARYIEDTGNVIYVEDATFITTEEGNTVLQDEYGNEYEDTGGKLRVYDNKEVFLKEKQTIDMNSIYEWQLLFLRDESTLNPFNPTKNAIIIENKENGVKIICDITNKILICILGDLQNKHRSLYENNNSDSTEIVPFTEDLDGFNPIYNDDGTSSYIFGDIVRNIATYSIMYYGAKTIYYTPEFGTLTSFTWAGFLFVINSIAPYTVLNVDEAHLIFQGFEVGQEVALNPTLYDWAQIWYPSLAIPIQDNISVATINTILAPALTIGTLYALSEIIYQYNKDPLTGNTSIIGYSIGNIYNSAIDVSNEIYDWIYNLPTIEALSKLVQRGGTEVGNQFNKLINVVGIGIIAWFLIKGFKN